MPQRARDRRNLNEAHPKLHVRDDRAIEVGRQKIEHPKDRRKGKNTSDWEYHPGGWRAHAVFRPHSGGRPLQVRDDDRNIYDEDVRREMAYQQMLLAIPSIGPVAQPQVNLWEMAKPGKQRDRRSGFEMISRPAQVIALDDSDEDEDFEFVERMPAPSTRGGKGRKSFAQALQRKRRFR